MNISIEIDQELWDIIKKNYTEENYTSAILDAIHLLTETIRNKTGLEGDGASLIGQAFGGENPKIQVNKLQTDSEKDIQKGIQEILKGFYTAIRNPRSHDKFSDPKPEADSIITFVNYLLQVIDKSKNSFDEEIFLERVFDEHYVNKEEYSDLLVMEIPKRQRADVAIRIIKNRVNGNIYYLKSFMASLINKLEQPEIKRVYQVISEELKFADDEQEIRTILHICPATYWDKIDKTVRMRVENLLLKSFRDGRFTQEGEKCKAGALATWIRNEHLMLFQNKGDWSYYAVEKLKRNNKEEVAYIEKYFLHKICSINRDNIHWYLRNYIEEGLVLNNQTAIGMLQIEMVYDKEHPWWKTFAEKLESHPEIKYIDEDEMPF